MVIKLCVIGFGGFIGAIARYGLSGLAHRLTGSVFPVGTLLVNVLGCLVIGVLATLVADKPMLSPNTRLFLMIGLLGSFTTFSTFGYETVELLHDSSMGAAMLNVCLNVVLGVVAVFGGQALVRLVI